MKKGTKKITTFDLLGYTSNNLGTLLKQHNITQKDLSLLTSTPESTISSIKTGKQFPSIEFLLELKEHFDISIDDFITKNINPSDINLDPKSSDLENQEALYYNKYQGTYYVYYLDTSMYKGRDFNSAEGSLKYGILHIYKNPTPLSKLDYDCVAILGISTREEAYKVRETVESFEDIVTLLEHVNKNYRSKTYYGKFELTRGHAFLSMAHQNKNKMLAIFYRTPVNEDIFNGGIGTVNSVSDGREPMPAVHFMALSREKVSLSCEEIHHHLLLHYPSFKAGAETEDLIRLFKNLYLSTSPHYEMLTELQKATAIQSNLERYIKKALESNIFRYGKISNRDDEEWCQILKDAADNTDNI